VPDASSLVGLARSLVIYYGKPFQARRLTRFYANWAAPGDLCFDIGAHVGNRLRAWRRLGARVVAVEPQPLFTRWLRLLYGSDADVILLEQAVGAEPGQGMLLVSRRTPTVSTLSAEWVGAVRQDASFATVRWEPGPPVRVTTLDELIARFGRPAFCKIDIEGYELEALKGLSQPLPSLSFEYIPATVAIALGCLDRLAALGDYRFNLTVGEGLQFRAPTWLRGEEMAARLQGLRPGERSGDIYARLADGHG
jgi:FkbM family methyltransferase